MTDQTNAESANAAPGDAARPAPVVGSKRDGIAIAAIVLAVASLAVAGSVPFWLPLLTAPNGEAALDQRLAAASAALASQEARLARIEARVQQLGAMPDQAPAIAALGDRVGALERRPDSFAAAQDAVAQSRRDAAAASARLDAIDAQVARLAATPVQEPSSDRLLLLAIEELRASVAGSGPFAGALAATEALARGNDAAIAALAPLEAWAATGIPSTALLAHQFTADIAPAILNAAAPKSESDDWDERVLSAVRRLVVIRRVDDRSDPTAVAVKRAEAALATGDLAGAAAAVKSLSGLPAAAAPWLDEAGRRLAAEDALGKLTQMIAAKLGEAGH